MTHTVVSEWDKRKLPALSKIPSVFSLLSPVTCPIPSLPDGSEGYCHCENEKCPPWALVFEHPVPWGWNCLRILWNLWEGGPCRRKSATGVGFDGIWTRLTSCSLFPSRTWMEMWALWTPPAPTAVPYLPYHDGLLPSNAVIQNKRFLSEAAFGLDHSNRKINTEPSDYYLRSQGSRIKKALNTEWKLRTLCPPFEGNRT